MPTNDIFSKNVLRKIIEENLETLCQCIQGTVYQQWTAVILLMQFIEYVLKYKIQKYKIQYNGTFFPKTHEIKELYKELTDYDRKDIEDRFCKLMKDRPKSFESIEAFARRYNTSYQHWRYEIIQPNHNSDEKYFYLADTFTVLRALIESTNLNIDSLLISSEDRLEKRLLRKQNYN